MSDFDTVTEPSVSATRFPASKRVESEESGEDGTVGNTSEIGSPYIYIHISGARNKIPGIRFLRGYKFKSLTICHQFNENIIFTRIKMTEILFQFRLNRISLL